jgi:hypothetical protein
MQLSKRNHSRVPISVHVAAQLFSTWDCALCGVAAVYDLMHVAVLIWSPSGKPLEFAGRSSVDQC